MANEIKYQPQIWGEPIEGERLSTNGHYTGEQRGTTTQDALVEMPKYYVEETIIRRGTITQDVLNKIEQDSGNPITFYVNGVEYTAEEGMTWDDFINSKYNNKTMYCSTCDSDHELFYINDTTIYYQVGECEGMGSVQLYYYYSDMDECIETHPSDEIEPNHDYSWR